MRLANECHLYFLFDVASPLRLFFDDDDVVDGGLFDFVE